MSYTPNHGDVFAIKDREHLGLGVNGNIKTFTPNQWYPIENLQPVIPKGRVVSLYSSGSGTVAYLKEVDDVSVNKIVGITTTDTVNDRNEVQSFGLFNYSSEVFPEAWVGQTAYVTPVSVEYPVGLTTDRTFVQTNNANIIIELGVIASTSSIFIDIEGDTRGSTPVAQFTVEAGEAIATSGVPTLVSIDSDGKGYLADKRKLFPGRNRVVGFIVGANEGFDTTIPIGTPLVVQRAGLLVSSALDFSGALGQTIVASDSGTFTPNLNALLSYADITCFVGVVVSATSLYVNISTPSYGEDSYPIGSIIAQAGANPDYGWLSCDGSEVAKATYQGLYDIIGDYYGTPVDPNNFVLPNSPTTPSVRTLQIKYLAFHQFAPIAPQIRKDTGWKLYTASLRGTTEVVTTNIFGSDPSFEELTVELFARNNASGKVYKIESSPAVVIGLSTTNYQYQATKSTAGSINIEFAQDGLAYYDMVSHEYVAVPTNSTWSYKIVLYKSERFNRYFDYTTDQKVDEAYGAPAYTVKGNATNSALPIPTSNIGPDDIKVILRQGSNTTVIPNFNASLLEGSNKAFYTNASNLNAGTLSMDRIANGAITAVKLASDSVTTVKILNANVTADKLASNSVTTAKIADLNVTEGKLANSAVTAGKLASDSVTTVKILNANVTADKLASNSVTTVKILNANVTNEKLAASGLDISKFTVGTLGDARLSAYILKRSYEWSPIVRAGSWSRIATTSIVGLGGTYFLGLSNTRSGVVVSASFLLQVNHPSYARIFQLSSGSYTQIQVRLTDAGNDNVHIEVIDSDPVLGTDYSYFARLTPVNSATATTISSYTAGSGTPIASVTTVSGGYNAAGLTGTNTLPDGVLSTNVPLKSATNTFTGANTFNSAATVAFQKGQGTAPFTVSSSTLVSNLNAQYVNGLDSAYLLNIGNATGTLSMDRIATGTITDVKIATVSASKLTGAGTLPDGVLSTNVPLKSASNTFTSTNNFSSTATVAFQKGQGTAPFTVSSTTMVNNLNASLLEDSNKAFYTNAGNLNAGFLSMDRIDAGAITADKLASNSVTTVKILNANVTNEKLAASGLDISKFTVGNLLMDRIAPNAITNAKINDLDASKLTGTLGDARLSDLVYRRRTYAGNLDNITTDGVYLIDSGATSIPVGAYIPGSFLMHHNWTDNNTRRQIFYNHTTWDVWTRFRTPAGWSTWSRQWGEGNDGVGSGLDADLLDGLQGSEYATWNGLSNYAPRAEYISVTAFVDPIGYLTDGLTDMLVTCIFRLKSTTGGTARLYLPDSGFYDYTVAYAVMGENSTRDEDAPSYKHRIGAGNQGGTQIAIDTLSAGTVLTGVVHYRRI